MCVCVHLGVCVAKKHVQLCNADLTGAFYVPASDNAECKVGEWQPKCGAHPGSRVKEQGKVRARSCGAGSGLEECQRRDADTHCQSG